jgi:hypothetical protein
MPPRTWLDVRKTFFPKADALGYFDIAPSGGKDVDRLDAVIGRVCEGLPHHAARDDAADLQADLGAHGWNLEVDPRLFVFTRRAGCCT